MENAVNGLVSAPQFAGLIVRGAGERAVPRMNMWVSLSEPRRSGEPRMEENAGGGDDR